MKMTTQLSLMGLFTCITVIGLDAAIKTTETKHKIPAEYDVPSKIYRPEQALPLIKRACDRRKARLDWGPEDFMEDRWANENDP